MARMREENGVIWGSDNVYADLGLTDPEGLMAKSHMIYAITLAAEARRLSDAALGTLLGLDASDVEALLSGPRDEFPLDRLAGILTALDQDVTITIRARPKEDDRPARILVETA